MPAFHVPHSMPLRDAASRLMCPHRVHTWCCYSHKKAFFAINLGGLGAQNRFYYYFEDQGGNSADDMRIAAIVLCLVGTFLTGPDIFGSWVRASASDDNKIGESMWWTISIMCLEDFPQASAGAETPSLALSSCVCTRFPKRASLHVHTRMRRSKARRTA